MANEVGNCFGLLLSGVPEGLGGQRAVTRIAPFSQALNSCAVVFAVLGLDQVPFPEGPSPQVPYQVQEQLRLSPLCCSL